ncbi:MAG: hypothetical protein ABL930_02450 [Pseudobdellovibrio sp.]
MDFNTYFNKSWDEHGDDSLKVASTFPEGIKFINTAPQITQFTNLVTHVMGVHLGKTSEGISILQQLESLEFNNADTFLNIKISKTILSYVDSANLDLSGFSDSEKVRIVSTAASCFQGLDKILESQTALNKAVSLASVLDAKDPANRSLAVSGNVIASTLEEKTVRSSEEVELMLLAAHVARKYWEIFGTWLEVERAEYRLAQSYLKARDLISSIKHANLCLTICEENKAPSLEFFFAYEAIAGVEIAMNQPLRSLIQIEKHFAALSNEDKLWCEVVLKRINTGKYV